MLLRSKATTPVENMLTEEDKELLQVQLLSMGIEVEPGTSIAEQQKLLETSIQQKATPSTSKAQAVVTSPFKDDPMPQDSLGNTSSNELSQTSTSAEKFDLAGYGDRILEPMWFRDAMRAKITSFKSNGLEEDDLQCEAPNSTATKPSWYCSNPEEMEQHMSEVEAEFVNLATMHTRITNQVKGSYSMDQKLKDLNFDIQEVDYAEIKSYKPVAQKPLLTRVMANFNPRSTSEASTSSAGSSKQVDKPTSSAAISKDKNFNDQFPPLSTALRGGKATRGRSSRLTLAKVPVSAAKPGSATTKILPPADVNEILFPLENMQCPACTNTFSKEDFMKQAHLRVCFKGNTCQFCKINVAINSPNGMFTNHIIECFKRSTVKVPGAASQSDGGPKDAFDFHESGEEEDLRQFCQKAGIKQERLALRRSDEDGARLDASESSPIKKLKIKF